MSRLQYAFADGAATITLAQGDRGNPIDLAFVDELLAAIRLARDDDARVVVLRAEGRYFSVGGDVGAMHDAARPEYFIDDLAEGLHRAIGDLGCLNAVVIAAVQGPAAGAGVSLATAADLVLASESATFTLAYTRIGLTPDGGSTLLGSSIGLHKAMHMALLNPTVSALDAFTLGFVSQVEPDHELKDAVEAVTTRLLDGSRTAQVGAKRLLREHLVPHQAATLRREAVAIRAAAGSPDGKEGVDAFVAKRRPAFPTAAS
ncbi:MAG: 2-(1,2-epoxy,2-dihydrophenyl)acetyl-CoA isomerase [Acidimicrobiaceae bacterium]|jgi:2-(1,2-epoxy-1,2-dihydrophenyl)acetyl-CoA isomerase